MKFARRRSRLTVVGAGIAGCMCALFAARAGYRVTLVSKSADPRSLTDPDPFSSTFGGEDSRYVTITEGHPYLGASDYVDRMYPDMQGAFNKPIHQGGWLSKGTDCYEQPAQNWLARRYEANNDRCAIQDLFEDYIAENLTSMKIWQQLFRESANLKVGISLHNSGILRLYGDENLYHSAKEFHVKREVLLEEISCDEIAKRFPSLAESVSRGFVRGALVVEGLTFRVQELVRNILRELDTLGAAFYFNCEVERIVIDGRGRIARLRASNKQIFESEHYSIHLGAYDSARILQDLGLADEIAGVAGGWIVLPKPEESMLPIKVHDGNHVVAGQRMPVVDLNINPVRLAHGTEVLIIGGGYLFVGHPPFEFTKSSSELMLSEIHRVSELVLGSHYRRAFDQGMACSSQRICVRSFTAKDRELQASFPTTTGGVLTIGGGGNTGTTAKAAWVASELVQTLDRIEERALVS